MKRLFFILLASLFMLFACNADNTTDGDAEGMEDPPVETPEDGDAPDDDTDDDSMDSDTTALPDLPVTKTETMMIEGMEEEMILNLLQGEEADFSVYIPDDMQGAFNDGDLDVYTNFDGTLNEDARLFIYEEIEADVLATLESKGFTTDAAETMAFDFTDTEQTLVKEGFSGRIGSFTHEGDEYTIGYYYPSAFGDGFSARLPLIVDSLVWHDS
ncbi:hypothetical protein [Halolactibacillus halophilus]|nr:hypothetical protein [Halolactibacillus halophilus]